MPGDCLGHFELVEYTGGGGMGKVFRAIDTRLARSVALKILPPDQAADSDALQRFQNEAQSAARLDHDNIARVYYVGEDRGLHYIVFEFVEGLNVRELVERKGPLPLAEAISYTLQAAEALAHADAKAVVHRDIKPSNLLITPEGRVKLIDMGLARLRHVDPAAADLTASGVTLGTFDYISPEQARDPRNADIRSDIYSLGCTFFYMLAGQPPFPEGTVLQKLLQHQGDQPPDIRQLRPELPEESGQILRKMMAKDPRHRYPSAAELVADLLLLAEQIGLRPMSPTSKIWLTPPQPRVPLLQRHLPWIAPAAALVCIVVLLDLFWSSSARRDDVPLSPVAGGVKEAIAPSSKTPPREAIAATRSSPDDKGDKKTSQHNPQRKGSQPNGSIATTDAPEKSTAEPPAAVAGKKPAEPDTTAQDANGGLAFDVLRGGISLADGGASPGVAAPVEDASPGPTGAAHGAANPGESGSSAEPKRPGLLIVGKREDGENEYATLGAACAAARSGDVIELRYDGPREERPMKMSNLRVTIRAGEGCKPVVLFRPSGVDPVKCPRSMYSLNSGRLTLTNVAVEFEVPREVPADNWSLFETRGGQTVRLEKCSLTIRNASAQLAAYHQDVAFFRARSAPESEGEVVGSSGATPLATVELTDCIARGEAALLRVEDLQPVHLLWNNGLLATTEWLLSAAGGQAAPKPDEMLRLELRHVTAAVRGGLCRLTSSPAAPYQLNVQFVCDNCILLGAAGLPLIEQEGAASVESFRQHIVWNGDRNYYEDVDAFWTIRVLDPETPAEVLNFDAWKAYWGPSRENQPSTERLAWRKVPEANTELHDHTPADYTLDGSAIDGSVGGPPGSQTDRLPQLPSQSAEEVKQKAELHPGG